MDTKVALVLHGKVGGKTGKHKDNEQSSKEVLEIAYKHNKEHIIDPYEADVFLHSWSTELENEILDLYRPKSYIIEDQIQFEVPDWILADRSRAIAHLSRWFSFREACCQVFYYNPNGVTPQSMARLPYDVVIVQRFDLVWNITPTFFPMLPNSIFVGKSTLDINKEWSDRWFASHEFDMIHFSNLYHCLESYMYLNGPLPSNKQYGGISSHQLSKFHAEKLKLNAQFKYNFGGYGQRPNDYNEVRRQYFGDDR